MFLISHTIVGQNRLAVRVDSAVMHQSFLCPLHREPVANLCHHRLPPSRYIVSRIIPAKALDQHQTPAVERWAGMKRTSKASPVADCHIWLNLSGRLRGCKSDGTSEENCDSGHCASDLEVSLVTR